MAIKVVNVATNVTVNVVSSERGRFNAANLPPGTYRLEATLQGFRNSVVAGIVLTAGATARIDVALNLGAMTEIGERRRREHARCRPKTRRSRPRCRTG